MRAIICDQGPNNRSTLTKLGFTKDKPWIDANGNKIFSVYDVPHLIKNIRNNFLTSDLIFKNNRVSFQDIKKTYMIDKHSSTSRSLLKITDSHILALLKKCFVNLLYKYLVSQCMPLCVLVL